MSSVSRIIEAHGQTGAIERPYLVFLGDSPDLLTAKTAIGVHHWRPDDCAGQMRLERCQIGLGLPDVSPREAVALEMRTLLIGLAPAGGALPPHWVVAIREAIEAGLDIASGLHVRLRDIAEIVEAASRCGRVLHDVRHPHRTFAVGSYRRRSGQRLLTVGTDCAVGKMFTALSIEREMKSRGISCDFRATGQTGILIAGYGVSVDAVIADFISGAAESLTPDALDTHWDIIEGQGSLSHPSYAGVSLGLLHGSQPDAIIVCHQAGRRFNGDFADLPLPSLAECAAMNLESGRLTNPDIRLGGCSLNAAQLSPDEATKAIHAAENELGVPCIDPVRNGAARLVDHLLEQTE